MGGYRALLEDDLIGTAQQVDESVIAPSEKASPKTPKIDKDALTRRIWEILEAQQRAARDRYGH